MLVSRFPFNVYILTLSMLRAEDQNMHFTNKAMFFSASESIVADPRNFKVCLSAKTSLGLRFAWEIFSCDG